MPEYHNPTELEFILALQKEVQSLMHPVPVFIFSPSRLSDNNRERVMAKMQLNIMAKTFDGIDEDKLYTIPDPRIAEIVDDVSMWELWRRSFLMRLQWMLQLLFLCIIGSLVLNYYGF